MNKSIIGLSVAAILAIPALTESAQAASQDEVSRREYNAVHGDMTIQRVHRIFDTSGELQFRSGGYLTREYPGWKDNIIVTVTFVNQHGVWRVGHDKYTGVWKAAYNSELGLGHD